MERVNSYLTFSYLDGYGNRSHKISAAYYIPEDRAGQRQKTYPQGETRYGAMKRIVYNKNRNASLRRFTVYVDEVPEDHLQRFDKQRERLEKIQAANKLSTEERRAFDVPNPDNFIQPDMEPLRNTGAVEETVLETGQKIMSTRLAVYDPERKQFYGGEDYGNFANTEGDVIKESILKIRTGDDIPRYQRIREMAEETSGALVRVYLIDEKLDRKDFERTVMTNELKSSVNEKLTEREKELLGINNA